MKRLTLFAIGAMLTLPIAIQNFTPPLIIGEAAAPEGMTEYSLYSSVQNIHAKALEEKVPTTISSEFVNTIATNYQQNSIPSLYASTASYIRFVVEAPAAGTYNIALSTYDATADLPVIVYTNSYENALSTTLGETSWWNKTELQYSTISLNLEEGKNAIVIQFNSWGNLVTLSLDDTLTLVDFSSQEDGVYNQADFTWNCTWVENPEESLWNPDIFPEFTYLKQDGSSEYEGAATLSFAPQNDTKSLDFVIQVDETTGLENTLRFSLDGVEGDYTFVSQNQGGEETLHLPSYFLEDLGFVAGEETKLRITNPVSSQEIRVLEMRESNVIDEEPVVVEGIVYEGEALKNALLVHGRSLPLEQGIALDWSGAGIEFNVEGGGEVRGNFDVISNSSNTRFAVEINGEFSHYFAPGSDSLIVSNLPEELTRIRLYKTSEANGNLVTLNSLTHVPLTEGEGVLSKVESTTTKKMLFLGASIICGNQMNADGDEDQYQAFATLLAKAWNADSEFVSVSGRGVIQGTLGESSWAADNTKQISDIWTKTSYFRDESAEYDLNSYVPDLIVTNLGNNDLGVCDTFGNTEEDVAAAAVSYLETLKEQYPSTKIIFTWGLGTVHTATAAETFRAAIEGMNNPDVAFLDFPPQLQGQGGHPSYYQHDYIAQEISRLYSEMTGEEDPYTRRFDWKSYEAEEGKLEGASISTEAPGSGQNWSGSAYVGSFSSNSFSLDEIASDGSNVSHIKLQIEVEKDGVYELQIGYATQVDTDIAYNVDGGDYTLVENLNTDDWCGGHGHYAVSQVSLTAGTHTLIMTGPIGSGWLNYDYVNTLYLSSSTSVLEADSYSESFLSITGESCDPSGEAIFPSDTWEELATSFEALSDEAKSLLVSSPKYFALRERYSYIQAKYDYRDFLVSSQGRVAEKINVPMHSDSADFNNGNDYLPLILGISISAGIALLATGYLVYRKKRKAL